MLSNSMGVDFKIYQANTARNAKFSYADVVSGTTEVNFYGLLLLAVGTPIKKVASCVANSCRDCTFLASRNTKELFL